MRISIKTAHNLFGFKISFSKSEQTRPEVRDVVYGYWDSEKGFTSHQEISESETSIGEYYCYGFASESDARKMALEIKTAISTKITSNDSFTA
jgi:hypothetical protein